MTHRDRPSTLSGKFSREMFFATSPDLPRIIEIDLDRLTPNPDQPRKTFDAAALQELADSIARRGLIQPVVVREAADAGCLLVAGERRYRAHQLLRRTTIAAIVTQGNPDEIALIENLQREDLNPIDAAEALALMMERHRYSQEDLGRTIGKNRVTVNELLRLNTLPQKIKDECRTSDTPQPLFRPEENCRTSDTQARLESMVLAALGWVGWVWLAVARQLRRGAPSSPPLFASANGFALGIPLPRGIGASPLHLLWWFPLGAVLGVWWLASPVWVRFNRACLRVLAGWIYRRDPPNAPSRRRGPETAVPRAPAR